MSEITTVYYLDTSSYHLICLIVCAYLWHAFRIARLVYNVALGILW